MFCGCVLLVAVDFVYSWREMSLIDCGYKHSKAEQKRQSDSDNYIYPGIYSVFIENLN